MISSNRSASRALRLEVGSSKMRMRASHESALATSTSCRCAIASVPHGVVGSRFSPTRASHLLALVRMVWRSRNPKRAGSRPRKIDPAMSRFSARFNSWCTSAMPARVASRTECKCTARNAPSASVIAILPSLGGITPERILRSVLLPAPFSPTIANTSPARTESSIPASARTPA